MSHHYDGFTQVMQLHIIYTGKSSYLSSPEQSFYICGKHCKNLHDNKKLEVKFYIST